MPICLCTKPLSSEKRKENDPGTLSSDIHWITSDLKLPDQCEDGEDGAHYQRKSQESLEFVAADFLYFHSCARVCIGSRS